jgi:hypothetical protein
MTPVISTIIEWVIPPLHVVLFPASLEHIVIRGTRLGQFPPDADHVPVGELLSPSGRRSPDVERVA